MFDEQPKAKPKAKPKVKAAKIPPNPTRVYGAIVYTTRTDSKAEAARLVGKGYKLIADGPNGYELAADSTAYKAAQ